MLAEISQEEQVQAHEEQSFAQAEQLTDHQDIAVPMIFSPAEILRATEHLDGVDSTVNSATSLLIPQAIAQRLNHFEAKCWIMRLTWPESIERAGFWDCPADVWPTERIPESSKLQGSALILWQWLHELGWSPYLERALFAPLGSESRSLKPAGDFRGYFFYIGIRWTVSLQSTIEQPLNN